MIASQQQVQQEFEEVMRLTAVFREAVYEHVRAEHENNGTQEGLTALVNAIHNDSAVGNLLLQQTREYYKRRAMEALGIEPVLRVVQESTKEEGR